MHLFKNLKLADNAIGYTHASGNFGQSAFTSRVVDSLFVGETDNVGNPRTPEEKAYGRSLPFPELADFPIRGYEFYDFHHELDNVTFVNFEDNATRKTGAISYLLFTSFGVSSNNVVERATFTNAKPVYFPPMEYKWSNDDYGNVSYWSSVFHDKDGTVGGVPNSYILINEGIAIDEACEIKPTWNAAVCTGDIGRMSWGRRRRRSWWRSVVAPEAGLPVPAQPLVPPFFPQESEIPAPPVLAHLEVERGRAAVPVRLLRQSFSAAMAGSSPSPGPPTYEPVPRSR
jgi:hypothetical protein